jgi:hypothetical protein
MLSSERQPGSEANSLPGLVHNPCPFGHLIRNSWSNDGDSASALTRPNSFVSGTMRLHGSMAESIS